MKIEITEIKAKLIDTSNKEEWDVDVVFWEVRYHAYFPAIQGKPYEHHINGELAWLKEPNIVEIKKYLKQLYHGFDNPTTAV